MEGKTAALIAELPANEAKLVAAESIVRALGVTDGPGFDALMDALTADGSGSISNAGGEWGMSASSAARAAASVLYAVLKGFHQEHPAACMPEATQRPVVAAWHGGADGARVFCC